MYRELSPTPSQFFALKSAQTKSYVAGVAGFMVPVFAIGAASAAFDLNPTAPQLIPIGCMLLLAACCAYTAVWVTKGSVAGVLLKDGEVALVGRNGKPLARAPANVQVSPARTSWQNLALPAVALEVAGRRIVVQTWRSDLGWSIQAPEMAATHRLDNDALWPTLVAALRLDRAMNAQVMTPPAPPGPPPRQFPLPVLTVPLGILAAGGLTMTFRATRPLAPECLQASRCCLARVDQSPPVDAQKVASCVKLATSARSSCTASAGEHCDPWPLGGVRGWSWDPASQQTPAGDPRQEPRRKLYPRVSCKEAVDRLLGAIDERKDGAWVAIRCSNLTIKALTRTDPDGFLYCDGYPIPIGSTTMWSRKLMIEGPGPHAVLARPLASGRYQVAGYCLRCDVVGKEISKYGRYGR